LLPNLPCCNSEDLHEEGAIEIVLSNLQHLEEGGSILPLDSYRLPTSDRKRASEEEMHSCFFSLRVKRRERLPTQKIAEPREIKLLMNFNIQQEGQQHRSQKTVILLKTS